MSKCPSELLLSTHGIGERVDTSVQLIRHVVHVRSQEGKLVTSLHFSAAGQITIRYFTACGGQSFQRLRKQTHQTKSH